MKEGSTIYTALSNDAAVSAVVSTRIYPFDSVPINPTKPFISYQRISGEPAVSMNNDTGTPENVREQIDCWGDDVSTVDDLADKVRTAMVTNFSVGSIFDLQFYEPDTELTRVSLDFSLWL